MKRTLLVCVVTLALLGGSRLAFADHSPLAAHEQLGVEDGAAFAMFVPTEWNGRLVLYAHGFVDPAAPIALPDVLPADIAPWVIELRETLLGAGFAVAYSSYAENGWAVKDGFERTHELRAIFIDRFGTPTHVYVIGRSLGALITMMLAEKRAEFYQGALPLCGPVGGGVLEANYIGNVRVLFDFFFPDVIPGDAVNVPPLDFSPNSPLVLSIIAAIVANPEAAIALASVDQIELPWTTFPELINSIVRSLGYNIRGTNDVLARTGGASPFGNTDTRYSGLGRFDRVLNDGVDRFEADEEGIEFLERFYQPRGKLTIPVLTLHTTLDPDVPFFHEAALAHIVRRAGRSKWLVQESMQRYGHCNFTPAEVTESFLRLVDWAEKGVKPAGGVLP